MVNGELGTGYFYVGVLSMRRNALCLGGLVYDSGCSAASDSFVFSGMGAVDLPLRASNEGLLVLRLLHREQANRPSLRASSDHRFIVGALRARRMVACLLPRIILRPRVARARKIIRLHPPSVPGARNQHGCHSTVPKALSKNSLVFPMCCSISDCKCLAPARQSSVV
jgi:hypothetical protein